MPIPDFQTIMLPLLKAVNDGKEHSTRDITDKLAEFFQLSNDDRKELLSSGQQPVFDNRVNWAKTYLKKAGLVLSPQRGTISITDSGKSVLRQRPDKINVKFLRQFPDFIEFQTSKKKSDAVEQEGGELIIETPEELIESGYQRIRKDLESEILARIKECSPDFFERLVVELLVAMGYGGSILDAGKAIGRSGDSGIDGIIKEDKLGLDFVYVQAKRWDAAVVGRPEIQKFAGALQGQRARKGVFITTSTFSNEARDYVKIIDNKIVLIDGCQLAELMIDHNVGVSVKSVFEIKKIDSDYFEEE